MNEKCKWKRFQKVEESQHKDVKGVDNTSRYHLRYAKHAGKMSKFNHAHLQCVHNKCARFEEYQPKGVRGVDYTK
jgi:hypothetical protein